MNFGESETLVDMATASLYKRVLPSPPAIDLASSDGKKLFSEAIQNGTMESFFKLISYFQTQSEPAYCGLASLSMVLNALSIDPGRKWKGPWRWFDENMLDCCEPLERVKNKGISFGKVVCLAHCAGANIKAFRTNQSTIDDFRKYVMACSSSDNCHVISSYHRGTFKQTGTGHFSPIGGYHAQRDMALILDVARFKYPPHWVPLALLWEAMDTVDESTGQHRGFMLVSRHKRAPVLLYSLRCNHESWITTAKYMMDDVPELLTSETLKDVKNVLLTIFTSLPSDFGKFIKWLEESRRKETVGQVLSEEERGRLIIKEEVWKQLRETNLYKHVTLTLDQFGNIAGILAMDSVSSNGNSFKERCHQATNRAKPARAVHGTAPCGNEGQKVDKLVASEVVEPSCCSSDSCGYTGMRPRPASDDVLTVLLFALPLKTWSGIKDRRLLEEISGLVSMENHPLSLKEEISNLRDQLLMFKTCNDNKLEDSDFKSGSIRFSSTSQDMSPLLDEAMFLQRWSNINSEQNLHQNKSHIITSCLVSKPSLPRHGVFSLGFSGNSKHQSSSSHTSWDGIRHMNMIACPNNALYTRQSMLGRHKTWMCWA